MEGEGNSGGSNAFIRIRFSQVIYGIGSKPRQDIGSKIVIFLKEVYGFGWFG